jgi:hypothetical protein
VRRYKRAALVLTTGDEVFGGVHSGHQPALENIRAQNVAVLVQIGAGRQLHMPIEELIIDRLFAMIVRGGRPGIGPCDR